MNTQGIIATVGTILLFALIAFLVGWLQRKGILGTGYEVPPRHSQITDPSKVDIGIAQGYKDFPSLITLSPRPHHP